ncbi:Satratoxin biosynthesis SC1 cluster protein 4 [Pseudocercospora fuligena]|uniref:Satratoxin biosynthesis SC1 cluster protein 4 n=1 Tax=Pseudocercospora fuligena TaxID=685502 RepID=A0A8H6RF09_9PEZI|nr:Satratoxin biosynthesis SC1 cluster protein 4 [Pseudocercospora fuligena]
MRLGLPFLVVLSAVLGSARSASHFQYANEDLDTGDIIASNRNGLALQARALNETQLNELPQCAGQCLQEIAVRYGCAFEPDCFCNNGNITASIKACVGSNCTTSEGLAAQKFEADTCNMPVRDRGGLSRRLCWAMFTIATLFVFGRFLSRMRSLGGSGFWFDDYAVAICYALLVPTDVSCEIEIQNGLGMDMFRLSVGQIVEIMRWFYIGELFYNIIVMLTKVSLILLYLRIWTADSASSAFRVTCWILIGILLSTATAGIFGIIFQCTPINYAWLSVTGTVQGHCIALEPFTYTYGALNISYDVVVFFLPIHSLLKLRVPWPKKLGLCSVFLVGFLVTICSIIRLQYLVRLSETENISCNFQYIGMWSLVEANFSIVCCCMPAMAGLAQRIWSKSSNFSSSHGSRSKDTQQIGAGPDQSISGSPRSDSDPTYVETALEKGHQDRLTQQEDGPHKLAVSHHEEEQTAIEVLDRERTDDRPTSALLFRQRAGGGRQSHYVEIAHEPPAEASIIKLSYRDQHDILHEVEIIDRPQRRATDSRSLRAQRASQMQRMETFGFGERTARMPSTGSARVSGGFSTNTTPSITSPVGSPAVRSDSASSGTTTPRRTSRVGVTLFGGP